ncbi:MAG: hypothetical protein KDD25_06340 [Bdellovibrionales bacterium]|nr:hypothetical protein [Bdellovibrionales bacterium]
MSRLIDSVYGNKKLVSRIFEAISSDLLPQTLLFAGPEGIGKKKIAIAAAQGLVCENPDRPCGKCGPCLRIEKNQSESLMVIEPGSTGMKVDEARSVIQFTHLQVPGRARVIVIDEAHRMGVASSNALLKTLEEPPDKTYFFLVAPSAYSVIQTVRSRSQIYRFGPLLPEEMPITDRIPKWAIQSSQGRMDRLQSLTESLDLRKEAVRIFQSALEKESPLSIFSEIKAQVKERENAFFFIQIWKELVRDILCHRMGFSHLIHEDIIPHLPDSRQIANSEWIELGHHLNQLRRDIEGNVDRTLAVEDFWINLKSKAESGAENVLD